MFQRYYRKQYLEIYKECDRTLFCSKVTYFVDSKNVLILKMVLFNFLSWKPGQYELDRQ